MKKIIITLIAVFLILIFFSAGQIFGWWDFKDIEKSFRAIIAPLPDFPIVLTPDKPDKSTLELKEEKITEIIFCNINLSNNPVRDRIIFSEIAWMGGLLKPEETATQSANNEWIELKNLTNQEINLSGWQILDKDNQIRIVLGLEQPSFIFANGFFLLERTNDDSVFNITADFIYRGRLGNSNETLYLFSPDCQLQDKVLANPKWPAGDNKNRKTMERKQNLNWQTSLNPGGTPRAINSLLPITLITPIEPMESTEPTEPIAPIIPITSATPTETTIKQECAKNSIEINTAFKEELKKLIDVGQTIAERIIEERQKKLFSTLDDLIRVKGIGPAILQNIKDQDCAYVYVMTGALPQPQPQPQPQSQPQPQPQPEPVPTLDPVSMPIPASNFLLNEFFEKWSEPANSAEHLHNWNYSGHINHITRNEIGLKGNYSVKWTPITTSNNLIQTGINITNAGTYHAKIWIKPLNVNANNYIRISLDIADPINGSFPRATFTNYTSETGWIELRTTRNIETGQNGGIRIRSQRSGSAGPSFLIGAVWLSTAKPPENWPLNP
jgi:DNA uptake protein ComE-like DNA-binding protein